MIPVRIPLLALTLLFFSCEKETPPSPGKAYYNSLYYPSYDDCNSTNSNCSNWKMQFGDSTVEIGANTLYWTSFDFHTSQGLSGSIQRYSTYWYYWELKVGTRTINITYWTGDRKNWEVKEGSFTANVSTSSSDFSSWTVTVAGQSFDMSAGSSDLSSFKVNTNNWKTMDLYHRVAIFFVGIYIRSIHQSGIDL